MTSILIIDDERHFLEERFADAVYARDAGAAVEELKRGPWDEVWFDHDLGCGPSGMSVADWLDELAYTKADELPEIGQCYVHTANPAGSDNLMRTLAKHFPTERMNAMRIPHLVSEFWHLIPELKVKVA